MRAGGPLRELTVIWGALVGGVVMYTVVLWILTTNGTLELAVLSREVVSLVAAIVILYMVGAVYFRRRLVAAIPALTTPEERLARYRNVTIVSLALMESGGLIVVTLGLLAGAETWILAGGGAAVVIMLFARPTADELEG